MDGTVHLICNFRFFFPKFCFIVVGFSLLVVNRSDAVSVTGVSPGYGSLGGETRLTIYGSDFSTQFSLTGDINVGSHTTLASSSREFPCATHKDGSTEIQITCYTPEGMPDDDYYVKVKVDGVTVPDSSLCGGNPKSKSCRFRPRSANSPTLTSVTPHSGLPGEFVTMAGELVTDRYGSNIEASSNGKAEKLLRIYVGPQDCGMKENDALYGLALDSSDSDTGSLKCKTKGTSVGFFNASFIVESPYGRSFANSDLYKVSYNDNIYMFQTYTDITSVSPATGSTEGGLSVTVSGNYFDNRKPYTLPKVYVGDTVCEVTSVVIDSHIVCTLAADPGTSVSSFPGNRGVDYYYWTATTKNISNVADVLLMNSSSPGYVAGHLDDTYYVDANNLDNYVSRMDTFFSPPHDGQYQFILKANDGAKLFVNETETLSSTGGYAYSSKKSLLKASRYLLQVVHFENTQTSMIELKVKFFDTQFKQSMTGNAVQDTQNISVSSTVVKDVQELTFADFTSQTPTNEVQTLVVNTLGSFRIGLFGVYTGPLDQDTTDKTMASELSGLPCLSSSESVGVVRQQTSSTPTYVLTFSSPRGDFPDVTVVTVANQSTVSYTVTQTKKGVPDLNTVAFMMERVVSPPIALDTITSGKLQTAIETMFGAQCPSFFESASTKYSYNSFETSGSYTGTKVKDTDAFCGRYSLKNPWRVYQIGEDDAAVMLSQYKTICFAYKGILSDYVWMAYSYMDASDKARKTRTDGWSYTFNKDSSTESTTWYYTCIDMLSLASAKRPSDSDFRMEWVRVKQGSGDIHIDSVFVGREDTTTDFDEINTRRLPAAQPNNALIDDVGVTGSGSSFVVTLTPFECADQFPLFELANGKVKTGRIASPSTSAKLVLSNGGSASVSVSRTSAASPPITGSIDVTFNSVIRRGLNISLEQDAFKKELMSLAGIGDISVVKSGSCANFNLTVTFLTLPGDLPEMTVDSTGLSGIDVATSVSTVTDGGLLYTPLTGDMLSTVHTTPQVRTFINDVPTKCSGSCDFSWSSAATPTVTDVTPNQGTSALATTATITGTGFDATPANNAVTIGGVACTVTASTTTSITCSVGNGPVGSYKVLVNVAGKGVAAYSASEVKFSYVAEVQSIAPTTGGLGGGLTLTVTGYGFKSDAVVTVGGNSCPVVTRTSAQITCTLPRSASAGVKDVIVSQGQTTLSYTGFNYDSSLTATVTSIVPSSIGVQGGTITITGSSMGLSGSVMFGSTAATVFSRTASEIVATVASIAAGTLDVKVETTNGNALLANGNVPELTVTLRLDNVSPTTGSLYGGSKLTITGTGFGTNISDVSISVGSHSCDVDSVSNTEVKCKVADTARVHQVTNDGSDPAFGVYYAFDKPYVTVDVGDFVQWSWTTPEFINDVAHSIIQIEDTSATTAKAGGFNSGTPLKNGQFRYRFTEPGIYYVWSGYVDVYQIKNYVGTVEVVSRSSQTGLVDVRVGGMSATHNVGGSAAPTDSSSCQATTSSISGCSDAAPVGSDSAKMYFGFWTCNTPVVHTVTPRTGTTKTDVTLTGSGFSTKNCQNEVTLGTGYACTVTSSSGTSVTCNVDPASEAEVSVIHDVSLRVGNHGYALMKQMNPELRTFGIVPNVISISPSVGSKAGGTMVTLTGSGFGDVTSVNVNGYTCTEPSISYTQITCLTPATTVQGEKNVVVTRTINGSPVPATCETTSAMCRFRYASVYTPTLSSITPDVVSGATTLTIAGTRLGTDTSAVSVKIGDVTASVSSVSDTSLAVTVDNLAAGSNAVDVTIAGKGKASSSLTVNGTALISSVTPSQGSVHGGTFVTIAGNGFVTNQTTVTIGGVTCDVQSVTLAQVTCITGAKTAGAASLDVTSNSVSYTSDTFTYSAAVTPTITSVNPTEGLAGATLTISGSNFDASTNSIDIDGAACTQVTATTTQLTCTLGAHATGAASVIVNTPGQGLSNSDIVFNYQLTATAISPTSGGIAGGQAATLSGSGFDSSTTVTICGTACVQTSVSTTEFVCKTPATAAQTCDVIVSTNGLTAILVSVYTYSTALTPSVTGVTPARGGTGGGTTLTLQGSGFGTTVGDTSVTIDGAACAVTTVTDTAIVCVASAHSGSIETTAEVQIAGNGIAQESTAGVSSFEYIDVWSSTFTWGGGPVPAADEFVVIPAGMTLLLDTDTPILGFLLIQGKLIFDAKDIELQAKYILITDGGALEVGTEASPFQHKAIITLHGHHRSKELPIYGTKVLGVRNGTLDLHGIEIPITWTRLASTAAAGSNTLILVDPVEWNVGDEIVIAATGHHHTQSENEKKTITAISGDKRTLTLDSNLEAAHHGTEETFDGTLVEFRAEVGLLTHNVVVRGNRDPQWTEEIKACAAGFNTGEFATQTCFLGRFGDEIGSSQFGAMILIHSPVKDDHSAIARLSYIEVTFAGQAFRLGRYPVHFHLNGDMHRSYVRGLGIHETFNRAVNIHGSHNTMVEKTVIYNIMGGAFFLEDGIEKNNTLQYNLAVFVRESSSLLNDDITPASFWVTNPDNIIQHNAAAGGSHFGFWYRMHHHPEGPSHTTSVCPDNVPLNTFNNNTAHSFGWFGLWIFTNYFPLQGGCGGSTVQPAVFRGLTAWNNEKGAEAVNSGALQFDNFVLVQNKKAGYEGKKVLSVPLYTDDSPMVKDSIIVGKTTVIPDNVQGCTSGGIVLPYGAGFQVKNVRFVNFAENGCAAFTWTRIDGTCGDQCGGYNYHTNGLTFINSPNKAKYAWDWEGILIDKDGSLTGSAAGSSVVPTSGTVPSDCVADAAFSTGVAASVCPPNYSWHRFAFNNISPISMEGKNFLITNQYGTSSVPFRTKRLSHKPGWMCALVDGETYEYVFENADHIKNISFTSAFDNFGAGDYIFFKLAVFEFPDRFTINGGASYINATVGGIDPTTAKNGDWEWDNANNEIRTIVSGTQRSRRGMSSYSVDRAWSFSSFKCYYKDCIPPPDPDTVAPVTERPAVNQYWQDTTQWNDTQGYITNTGGSNGVPVDYDNVRIVFDSWMLVNTSISNLGTLLLEGVIEFMDIPGANYEINAEYIIIQGGRLIIGWPDNPFDGLASIVLRGNHSSPSYIAGTGPPVGAKVIGVFGGLDLFGKDPGLTWTKLSTTATTGTNQISLKESVTWTVDDEIVIGPTGFDAWQTETFKVTAVSVNGLTLTLNDSLKYTHVAHSETLGNGKVIQFAAPVGLLTRNIKIIGEDYTELFQDSFGARVLVGLMVVKGQTYTGYARLSNVEFYHTGQEGWTESYDARFSVAYIATGTVSDVKPSFVSRCAFHHGFNSAVGAFGIGGLNITENVVHHAVGNGLVSESDDTRILDNLVVLLVWTGAYLDRVEPFNFRYEAGIEAMEAKRLILQRNLVAGSERIGFHVTLEECGSNTGNYADNEAYSCLIGQGVLPGDQLTVTCAEVASYTVVRSHDFGLYYNNGKNVKFVNNVLIENRLGLFPMVIGSSPLSHVIGSETIEVSNVTFIGATSSFDCAINVSPANDDNIDLSGNSRSFTGPNGARIAVIFPQFTAGSNNAPEKPFKNIMSYNTIAGLMTLQDSTFAHFGTKCNGDVMITTSSSNEDAQHPLLVQRLTMEDVANDNKLFLHRPNVGKINSADCVDMDCDALKKAFLKDLDGSFLGHIGSAFSQSEFEWGGDPRRGLGDYRIPKELLTTVDGVRLDVNTVAPNKGIIRNNNCVYQAGWQAWECMADLNYEWLMIESMDSDTETRRLSPVAVLGDGYIDLINGPQDHGWCSGYTCRKRVSLFSAVVATEKTYDIFFTSTTPFNMRYTLLNAANTAAVRLSVWYSRPNRLDVYVNGAFIISSNARIDSKGQYIVTMPKGNEFMPTLDNATGTNFIDRDTGMIHFLVKGSSPVEVKTQDVIIVSFGLPAMTAESFFGDNIIENLAAFLNIPLTKVRVVNVISAASVSNSGRKRRAATGVVVYVEVGDEPSQTINGTSSNSISLSQLNDLATELVNQCQTGDVSATINATTSGCTGVEVPAASASETKIVYSTPVPDRLEFHQAASAEYEGQPLTVQPTLKAVDANGDMVTELGTASNPWQMVVSIRSGTGHANAVLTGTLTANSTDGWFTFTDLAISHMGTGYILEFNIVYPTSGSTFSKVSAAIDVAARPLKTYVVAKTSGDIVKNNQFSLTLDLRDLNTGTVISNIAWRSHTWTATARLIGNPQYGSISGLLTADFDEGSGTAMFPDLNITGYGFFYIKFQVTSTPAEYSFTLNEKIEILNPSHVGMVIEESYEMQVKFDIDYDTVITSDDVKAEFEQMMLQEYSNQFPDIRVMSGSVTRGSIMVTFTIGGSFSNVNATAYILCSTVDNSTSYTFNSLSLSLSQYMTVNNTAFYGVNCGATASQSSDDSLHPGVIAAIVIGSVLLMVIAWVLIWKFCIKTKPKSGGPQSIFVAPMNGKSHNAGTYVGQTNGKLDNPMSRENTFTSMRFNMGSPKTLPPRSTALLYGNEMKQPLNNSNYPVVSALSPEPTDVAKKRVPSPSRSNRSVSPMPSTASLTDVRGSPLPSSWEMFNSDNSGSRLAPKQTDNTPFIYSTAYSSVPVNDALNTDKPKKEKRKDKEPSPKRSHRSISPMPTSNFDLDLGPSPLPPTEDLYEGGYITTSVPRQNTIVFPDPVDSRGLSPAPSYQA